MSAKEVQSLIGEAQPYLALTPLDLAAMMPTRRGVYFSGGDPAREGRRFDWIRREPDTLRLKDGKVFDFAKIYPITGYEEVRVPSGKILRSPYHDPPGTVHLANVSPQFLSPASTATGPHLILTAAHRNSGLLHASRVLRYGGTLPRDRQP